MKIRRALAVAAATAVLAPVTLLSSPAAFATPSPTPEATESATASEEPGTPAAEEETETAPEQEKPAAEEGEEKPPAEEEQEKPAGEEEKQEEKPEEKAPAPSTTPPTPSPSVTAPSDSCNDADESKFDKNLHTSLSGLPSRIVAGSGFHGFELNVENKGDKAYQRVDLGLVAALIDVESGQETTGHLTVQFKNPETGVWTDISADQDDEVGGYIGYTGIRAQESFSIDLRLSVDKKAPKGIAYALAIGLYADEEGNCVYSEGDRYYDFDVLAAGTDAGEPNEAEPQTGGKRPVPVKPVGNTEIKPEGTLAQTGSDSDLPVIATIGGVAVLAGAGVVFALGRRRKVGATA